MAADPVVDDLIWVQQRLATSPFPLVGPRSWTGEIYCCGWGGQGQELQRVTLSHRDASGRALVIETAPWPHHTTAVRIQRHTGEPQVADGYIRVRVDAAPVELVRMGVQRWRAGCGHGDPATMWAAAGPVGSARPEDGDETPAVEVSIEARGIGPDDLDLVLGVDPGPYLRVTEELEQRRQGR